MNTVTPAVQNLARRLIAFEAARNSFDAGDAALGVCDKLRTPLAKLAGVAGFRSLLGRALALVNREAPWLAAVQVGADGSLEGFDQAKTQQGATQGAEAGIVVVSQLLGLLVTFVGAPLTLRLVRDVWPDAAVNVSISDGEGQP